MVSHGGRSYRKWPQMKICDKTRGGACCLGKDLVLPGYVRISTHPPNPGDRALRSAAAPRLSVPLWRGCGGGVSQLYCLGAVASGLSCPRVGADRQGSDPG